MQLHQNTSRSLHLKCFGALALILIYGFVCLGVIRTFVPIISSGDNIYFMPLSFMYLEKGELSNPWINPIGSTAFNWHGFIHPLAVAVLSIGNGWHGVNSGIIVLGVAAFFVFVILANVHGIFLRFSVPAAVVVISMIISFSGRPETTVAILCMFLYSAVHGAMSLSDPLRQRIAWLLSGALTGTIAAANPNQLPVVVFSLICFISAIYSVRGNVRGFCISLTVIFTVAIFSFLLLLLFVYPFGVVEWINGIIQAAHKSGFAVVANTQDYINNLLFSKDVPLIFLYIWFLVPIGLALYGLNVKEKNKVLSYSAFLLATIFMFRGLTAAFGRYNFTVFVPTLLLIVGSLFKENKVAPLKQWTLLMLYVLAVAALLTQFIWVYQNIASRNNADIYNSRLDNILSKALKSGLIVGVNSAILTAVDNVDQLEKVRLILDDSEANSTQFDLVILSQNEHPSERPIQLKNFKIVEVEYDACCSLFFPRPLNHAFAAYRSLDRTPFRDE